MLSKVLSFAAGAGLLISALASTAYAEDAAPAPAQLGAPPSFAATPLEPARLMAAQATLAYRLAAELAKEKPAGPNFVASPASLVSVFSLLELGASKSMRAALYAAFGFGKLPQDNAAVADFEALRGSLTALTRPPAGGPLSFANAILFDSGAQPYKLALAGLQATGADVSVEDLAKPELVKRVNDWVAARTNGLIPSIMDQPPGRAGLIGLNALYFKDRWQTPFDAKATDTAPFHAVGGRAIDVAMMHSAVRQLLFRQDDRFIAVDLPYATAGFSLVVATTKAGPARVTDFADASGWLTGVSFEPSEGQVALPRFSLASSADLLGALDGLGLKRARFSPSAFAGLSPVPQVIAQVLQRTVIKVDEEGTEAAAATAAVTKRSFTVDAVKMIVDKPFLFALRDQTSGLILLAGYVGDPTGGNASEASATAPAQ
jgi:serine protease inhibitor